MSAIVVHITDKISSSFIVLHSYPAYISEILSESSYVFLYLFVSCVCVPVPLKSYIYA